MKLIVLDILFDTFCYNFFIFRSVCLDEFSANLCKERSAPPRGLAGREIRGESRGISDSPSGLPPLAGGRLRAARSRCTESRCERFLRRSRGAPKVLQSTESLAQRSEPRVTILRPVNLPTRLYRCFLLVAFNHPENMQLRRERGVALPGTRTLHRGSSRDAQQPGQSCSSNARYYNTLTFRFPLYHFGGYLVALKNLHQKAHFNIHRE